MCWRRNAMGLMWYRGATELLPVVRICLLVCVRSAKTVRLIAKLRFGTRGGSSRHEVCRLVPCSLRAYCR